MWRVHATKTALPVARIFKGVGLMNQRRGFNLKANDTMGAVITGLDLSGDIAPGTADDLRQAWVEYPVLVFPGAGDSGEKQLLLSQIFGELAEHPNPAMRLKEAPELIALGATKETRGPPVVVGDEILSGFLFYHQDTYYTPSIAKGALLRMAHMPSKGGDTSFVDLEQAYAALRDDLKRLCGERQTIQVYREVPQPLWGMRDLKIRFATADEAEHVPTPRPDWPPVVQPMVVRNPVNDRLTLLMSPAGYEGIYGMEREEGDAFYDLVARHVMRPEFTYRHRWHMHDMLLWDNRRTMHWAMGYPEKETRVVKRTTLKGGMLTGRLLSELEA